MKTTHLCWCKNYVCKEDKRGFISQNIPLEVTGTTGAVLRKWAHDAVVAPVVLGEAHTAQFTIAPYNRDQISLPCYANKSPSEGNGSSSHFADKNEDLIGLLGTWGKGRGVVFFPPRKSNLSEMCEAVFNCFLPCLYIAIWLFIGCLCSDFYCNLFLYMQPSVH